MPDNRFHIYEDSSGEEGTIDFGIWTGISTSTDGDIRSSVNEMTKYIEYALHNYKMSELTVIDYYTFRPNYVFLNSVMPIEKDKNKTLYLITGQVKYSLDYI